MTLAQHFAARLRSAMVAALVGLALALPGCATVPPEAPELSYTVGQDLQALQESYRKLIRAYFDSLRQQVNDKFDSVFIPAFVNEFVVSGGLIQAAQAQKADEVEFWARIAIEEIDAERKERLEPLNKAEADLVNSVDQAFDRAIHANAIVTGHLNSVREVQEVQSKILESLGLEDLRQKINDTLAEVSNEAADINKGIEKAAEELNELSQ